MANATANDTQSGPGPTAYNVHFDVNNSPGDTHVEGLNQESGDKTSELLMINHEKYHSFFNDVGLHNHTVHHLCSLWALGATPEEIQSAYDLNQKYQHPHHEHNLETSAKLADPAFFKENLGNPKFYPNYLHFFRDLIEKKGVEEVLKTYLFDDTEDGVDLLGRLHSGYLHPMIHLGFGLEFSQPLLIAEALSSTCIHPRWPLDLILPTEKYLSSNPNTPKSSFIEAINSLNATPEICNAIKPTDPPDRMPDVLIPRTAHILPQHLSHWCVEPTKEDISHRLAEMMHTTALLSGACQHPTKKPSIEFFMMHSTNLAIFYPTLMALPWLSDGWKARLLNWKGWLDMCMYAANGCPALYIDRIKTYQPLYPGPMNGVIKRANRYPDDGHTAKFIRAILAAQKYTSKSVDQYGKEEFPLTEEDFTRIGHMCMDSVERMLEPGYELPVMARKLYIEQFGMDEEVVKIIVRFVRWCGLEGAWDDFDDLEGDEGKARL